MSSAGNQYINLAPTAAPLPYELQLAQLQRQQRLADQMRQESTQPIQTPMSGQYAGPISWGSVLGKVLQGVSASMKENRAQGQLKQIGQQDTDSAQALVRQLTQPTYQAGAPSIAPVNTQINPTAPQLPGQGAPAQQAPVPMQLGGEAGSTSATATPPAMPDQLAALLAARGGPQTQMIQQAMLPQILNRQNLDYQNTLNRSNKLWENTLGMSTAEQQRIDAQKKAQEDVAAAANKLPQTAAQKATTELGYAQLNKPIVAPFGATFLDPKTRQTFSPGGSGGAEPIAIDANSNSLNAQTGLSQLAIDRLTNAPNQPRSAALVSKVDQEITNYSIKNNINLATMRARAAGINNVVTYNTVRNNQGTILEREIAGSVQNLGPLLDGVQNGKIDKANVLNIWAGRQVNDPTAQQVVDQLHRLRSELAGYNAVAGGHLLENGTPHPTPQDTEAAEKTILDGINSGGARAVEQSVGKSAAKNRVVLQGAIDDANQQLWDAFGVGKNYKRTAPPVETGGGNPAPHVQAATEADIQHTMKLRNMSHQQVLDALKQKGIPIAP
jgi:hypothetical protein